MGNNQARSSSETGTEKLKRVNYKGQELIDVVLSWSLADVLDRNLYSSKVTQIPRTFSSVSDYTKSFFYPLLEETHADLLSKILEVNRSPIADIVSVYKSEGFNPLNKALFYTILIESCPGSYVPKGGDLIALTDVRPKSVDDLKRPNSYIMALVQGMKINESLCQLFVLSSKPINEQEIVAFSDKPWITCSGEDVKLFVVYLTNLTTNSGISQALHSELKGDTLKMIQTVMGVENIVEENCAQCSIDTTKEMALTKKREALKSFQLNSSQEAAVLSCIAARECCHRNMIKLIWGPPGSGKTKTIGLLNLMLLRMKCRTLTCAPTDIAVLGVIKRVMSLVKDSLPYNTYGLGDIVLFGDEELTEMNDCEDLTNIFLDLRVKILAEGLACWKDSSEWIISFLENPEKQYLSKKKTFSTFEKFAMKEFSFFLNRLISCIESLFRHMPTSFLSLKAAQQMNGLVRCLKLLEELLKQAVVSSVGLREALNGLHDTRTRIGALTLHDCRMSSLEILKNLQSTLCFPELKEDHEIKQFCLENACLIFSTASNSINLHISETKPLEVLVIDEASHLKECETLIPLQVGGLRHVVLVGDERQLPAMVESKISAEAEFGRSLFERLVSIGHKKHLLNVQYRMHPSISQFPNREFYDKQILDGLNVKSGDYGKRFLQGSIYGSYSFINVTSGKGVVDKSHSMENLMEVAIVAEIISNLYKEAVARKERVSVGCISPYETQVKTIQEKLGNKYMGSENYFSLNVQSIDGFQGSEEDVIIISTVGCNRRGSYDFFANRQRTNVALTRARYCLWIVGNGSSLMNSGSLWKDIIVDAKNRGCFHNVSEDKSLAQAAIGVFLELRQFDSLFTMDSFRFNEAKWQVKFSGTFLETIAKFTDLEICKELVSLLFKLLSGWRKDGNDNVNMQSSCTLLEVYDVTQQLRLIWAVDIVVQNSLCIQVLKIWDVLPATKVVQLAKGIMEKVYGNYTVNMMNRCMEKCVDGNLTLPISWPMNADTDQNWSLTKQLAAVSLKEQPVSSSSSRASSVGGFGDWKSNRDVDSRSYRKGRRW